MSANAICPQCGGQMQFRLGDYDCAFCGYTESRLEHEQRTDSATVPRPKTTGPDNEPTPRGRRMRRHEDGESAHRGNGG